MADSSNSKCRIMEASLEILSEKGYQNLSFSEIAEKADVSKSLINYHFDSKEELFNELFEWLADQTLEMKDEMDGKDIMALVDLLLPEDEEGKKIQRSILEIGMISGEGGLQEGYQKLNQKIKDGIVNSKKQEIDEAQADLLLSLLTGAAYRREMLGEEINKDHIKEYIQDCEP
ncbi:MAG: TetR/AcrR family transcriptional regulator [Candidatus Nanosalina sp.]